MTDFFIVELHNHNLNQFNRAWEEMLLSLDKNKDEDLLANLHKQTGQKVNTHEERFVRCIIQIVFSRRNQRDTEDCEPWSTMFSKIRDKFH